jgi:biopolymer transport protein ExbD
MAHGGGGDDNTEPDLTAMLDVVMQLLMYFIVTVNFIDQEKNPSLELPIAQVAKPLSNDRDYLALTIDAKGKLLILGESPKDLDSARIWLDNQVLNLKERSPDHTIHTAIKVRAHKDVDYEVVYDFMQICKEKGFKRFSMQVMLGHESEN